MNYLKSILIGILSLTSLSVSAGDTEESSAEKSSALFHVSGLVTDIDEEVHLAGHWVKLEIRNTDNNLIRTDSVQTDYFGEFVFSYKESQLSIFDNYYYSVSCYDFCSGEPLTIEGELKAGNEESLELEVCNECIVNLSNQIEFSRVTFEMNYNEVISFESIMWDFGDDYPSFGNDVVEHYYSEAGEYEVCVSYETTYGCQNEICTTVIIDQKTINDQNIHDVVVGNQNSTEHFEFVQFDNGNSITLIMKELLNEGKESSTIETEEISYSVEIISISGRSMYKVVSSNNVLDLPKFNSGIYYIVITNFSDQKVKVLPVIF